MADDEHVYKAGIDGSLMPERKVLTPEEDRAMFDLAKNMKVCGHCKYFELAEGQARMKMLKFLETLVHEHSWQVKHLAAHPEHLGLCGAADSGAGNEHTLTGMLHKACDQYRENRGLITLRKKGEF